MPFENTGANCAEITGITKPAAQVGPYLLITVFNFMCIPKATLVKSDQITGISKPKTHSRAVFVNNCVQFHVSFENPVGNCAEIMGISKLAAQYGSYLLITAFNFMCLSKILGLISLRLRVFRNHQFIGDCN